MNPSRGLPRQQSSWGQHGTNFNLSPGGPRWAPCWSHKPCYEDTSRILEGFRGWVTLHWRIAYVQNRDLHCTVLPFDIFTNRDKLIQHRDRGKDEWLQPTYYYDCNHLSMSQFQWNIRKGGIRMPYCVLCGFFTSSLLQQIIPCNYPLGKHIKYICLHIYIYI